MESSAQATDERLRMIERKYKLIQIRELLQFIPVDERVRFILHLERAVDIGGGGGLSDLLDILKEDDGDGSWEKP